MTIKSRMADLLTRVHALEPAVSGVRAAKMPAWAVRGANDDRLLRSVLAAILKVDSNAVDVGAARGVMLEEILRLAPNGQHVAFEPHPEAFAALARRFSRVDVRGSAVSDKAGTAEFTVIRNIPELSGLDPRPWPHHKLDPERIAVRTERLDDVIQHHIALIKIDVEGTEAQCLRGARRLLAEHKPLVAFEHGETIPGNRNDPHHREVWQLLTDAGLRVFTINGDGPLTAAGFAEASASGEMWNFIAS